ncbi:MULTISPECIES: DUF3180 family protein [unclassified Actinobaculum]|uniref:DUF3180 family protein n=1 Tax=unclassified Actinobaculum TaxID=2609299 RepID=UPI000D52886A|nr:MULTISPECIES: DUF3180 family protein [unclassified Actinobaculum]AWE42987.1 hypothetical protein DDD63_09830 [Actinobaculum sp. 313]RTE47756.1 DUF3180 family protein [Actinobaculum sp. 352]
MRRTTWWMLVCCAVVGVALGALLAIAMFAGGVPLVRLPLLLPVVVAAAAVFLLALGWQVRRGRAGRRSRLSALQSAPVAALAQASSRTGALLAGAAGAFAVACMEDRGSAYLHWQATASLWTAVASLLLVVAGVVVEAWCALGDGGSRRPTERGVLQ